MKYRSDIDGLRALAVVPVILFHAGFELFSGGFVGVDVFFVISGYLITTILIEDIDAGRFSLLTFYERRARRILPALFFVMLVCIPFAWMWMLPSQLAEFSKSLIAVSLFVSNILFWQENGYFAAASDEKPLLHTWSLAVEEQYYLLFPVFLVVIWRFGRNKAFWALVASAALSLAISEWGWRNKPTANFYLAPTRAWELFAGSLAAFILQKHGVRSNNPLALLGLGAILFSIFAYDETVPFPSAYALAPVLGTVLLILFAGRSTWAAKILSLKVFVAVGLISYSAYLWHQPLFAFARIRLIDAPSPAMMAALSVASLVLAYGTWKFVETPFRHKKAPVFSRGFVFAGSVAGLAAWIGLGATGYHHEGFPMRLPDRIRTIAEAAAPISASCYFFEFNDCFTGSPDAPHQIALVGDSHAGRYAYGLEALSEQGSFAFRLASGGWCAPLLHLQPVNSTPNPTCFPNMSDTLHEIAEDSKIQTVVLSARWAYYLMDGKLDPRFAAYRHGNLNPALPDGHQPDFATALKQTVELFQAKGKRVILTEPLPEFELSVPHGLAKALLFGEDPKKLNLPLKDYDQKNQIIFEAMNNLPADMISQFPVTPYYCSSGECIPYTEDLTPLYNDSNHLSALGLERLQTDLMNFILKKNS